MRITYFILVCEMLLTLSGCNLVLPRVTNQPVIRNPFPQLSRVAVAPFFNHSDEATVDGRQFALAYYAELQRTPGFEVVPLGVVEEAMLDHQIDLSGPGEARRLARRLGVDAVVVGAVTEFSPYYPPRCGLRVEWYTANPGFHEIPVGYGLPWNTPEEEFIPDSLVYESQLACARSQMATLSPNCEDNPQTLPDPPLLLPERTSTPGTSDASSQPPQPPVQDPFGQSTPNENNPEAAVAGRLSQAQQTAPQASSLEQTPPDPPTEETIPLPTDNRTIGSNPPIAPTDITGDWLTNGLQFSYGPNQPCMQPGLLAGSRPPCLPYHGPVMSHTQIYLGNDPNVTQALQSYVYFCDDARFGGWEAYLQRSDDFIRFCCHLHISEMLSARGGSRKTRVVWRWSDGR
jgi:hypothetical protein